jgi:CubicO group peptidase (beta-lactamase class C family)
VDRIARAVLKATRAPGMSVAVVAGEAVYAQGYGVRERGKSDPVTADTLFAMASTTKAFAATTLALLVDENKAGWDDPVRKHLPAFRLAEPLADAGVTLRDLLCHRTGLPRHDMLWLGASWDRAEVLRRVGFAKLAAGFREKYQYQNIAFSAAGEAVARAAATDSWEAFTQVRLLGPLGMTRTNFAPADALADPDHATGHRDVKHGRAMLPWRDLTNIGPAGAMNGCTNDLARWLRFQLSGGLAPDGTRLVSDATLRETHTPQMVQPLDDAFRTLYPDTVQHTYGLGWSVWDYRGGHRIVSHSGSIGGFRAQVALLPDVKAGVAVLCNMQSHVPEIVRNAVFDHLLGLPQRDWIGAYSEQLAKSEAEADKQRAEKAAKAAFAHPAVAPPRRLCRRLRGAGLRHGNGDARQWRHLTLAWSGFRRRLRHHHFDAFVTDSKFGEGDIAFDDQDVLFALDKHGEVATLTLFDEITFRKTKPKNDSVENA